jgi:putative PIN family toxin of toxin-antitoxin system
LRFVFDTNVIVSALLLNGSKPQQAFLWALHHGTVLSSSLTFGELYEVLSRKRFRKYIDEDEIRLFLASFTREAEWIDVDVHVKVCRDPKDDKFLGLAISDGGTHIVTGDLDLLALHPFRGIAVVSPQAVLEIG